MVARLDSQRQPGSPKGFTRGTGRKDSALWLGMSLGLGAVLFVGGILAVSALWSGGRDAFEAWFGPEQVAQSPSPVSTPGPTGTPGAQGVISGNLSSPGGDIPPQVVCAELVNNTNVSACTDSPGGQSAQYRLSVPAGKYYVFARVKDAASGTPTNYRAYFTQYIACGASPSCSSNLHSQYVPVIVAGGATVDNINPIDWYRAAAPN